MIHSVNLESHPGLTLLLDPKRSWILCAASGASLLKREKRPWAFLVFKISLIGPFGNYPWARKGRPFLLPVLSELSRTSCLMSLWKAWTVWPLRR